MKVLFVLDMPNNNSWNGHWSGEGQLYARIRTFNKTKLMEQKLGELIKSGYFYYDFGDGWGASVTVSWATAEDAKRVRKQSRGFSGYDWMIDSILEYGEILNSNQVRERRTAQVGAA